MALPVPCRDVKHGLLLVVGLLACGDNEPVCSYDEAADLTNDQTAETTGVHAGASAIGLCGAIDDGHFDATLSSVDVDRFAVTIDGSGDLVIDVVGDPEEVSVLESLSASIFTADANPTLIAAGRFDPALADHGAFHAQVPPGDYVVAVSGGARGDPTGSIDYRVALVPDPVARCPAVTRAADYTEQHDGDGTGNDAFEIDFSKTPPFTSVAGTPEATGLAIDDEAAYRISGTSVTTTATSMHVDEYLDRDTYEIRTTAATDELTLRVDWTDPAADLDFVVLEEATLAPAAISNVTGNVGPELAVFAVKPNTKYLVLVGSFMGGSGSTPYDITVCGAHFVH